MSSRELFQKGDRLGEYEVLSKLRAGGMATLFLGRRHGAAGVSRPVVIKVIHPHLAEDDLIVRMFIDEAQISSHITHQNVVYVEKFGEQDGVYFIVMEYVDGCSAEQLLRTMSRRNELLSPEVAVHIAIETAAGLHAAHETLGEDGIPLGIVHRDVSPSNILVTHDGNIKVIDFGIAKARNRLSTTQDGSGLKGKLRYMSPEQAWGRNIDRSADVYSLGVVLWELLTCKPLFKGTDDLAVLELVRNPEIPPPSRLNPEVPPALDSVVMRATSRDPAQRLQTAQELRRALIQAVPNAVSLPEEMLPQLVVRVRETLGPAVTPTQPEDDKPTTPNTPSRPYELIATSALPPGPQSDSSVRAGEIHPQPRRRSRSWVAIAGSALAAGALGAVIVGKLATTDAPDHRVGAPAASSDVTPLAAPPPPPPSVPVDAAIATPIDATDLVATPSPPVAGDKGKSKGKGKGKAAPIGPQAIDVDGSVLADDTATSTPTDKKRKPPPKRQVNVDGTVLSE